MTSSSLSISCPQCGCELATPESTDTSQVGCPQCLARCQIRPATREAIAQASAKGESVVRVYWREEPGDGLGQLAYFITFLLIGAVIFASVATPLLIVYAAGNNDPLAFQPISHPANLAIFATCAIALVAGCLLAGRLKHYFRGLHVFTPILFLAREGIYDVVSFRAACFLPRHALVMIEHLSGVEAAEMLTISYRSADGSVAQHVLVPRYPVVGELAEIIKLAPELYQLGP